MMTRIGILAAALLLTGCSLGNVLNRPTGPDKLFDVVVGKRAKSFMTLQGEPTGACRDLRVRAQPIDPEVERRITSALDELTRLESGRLVDDIRLLLANVYAAEDLKAAGEGAAAIEARLSWLEDRIETAGVQDLQALWETHNAGEVSAGCTLPVQGYDGRLYDVTCIGEVADKQCRPCGANALRCDFAYEGPVSVVGDTTIIATGAKTVSVRIR